jgi:hypothetical protein
MGACPIRVAPPDQIPLHYPYVAVAGDLRTALQVSIHVSPCVDLMKIRPL